MTRTGLMGAVMMIMTVGSTSAAAMPAVQDTTSGPAAPDRLQIRIGGGYDYFSHAYTLLTADTTSTLTEGSALFDVSWATPPGAHTSLLAFNRLTLTPEYWFDTADLDWRTGGFEGAVLSGGLHMEAKRYTRGVAYATDHHALRGNLAGGWRWDGQGALTARLDGESFDYTGSSPFFYDTRTLGGTLSLRAGKWYGPWGGLEIGAGHQAVPDSTLIAHDRRRIRLTGGWTFDEGGEVEAALFADERDYTDAGPRPDRHLQGLDIRARLRPLETWGWWLEGRAERQRYPRQTLVYNDGTDLRGVLGPLWHPGNTWEVRAGLGIQTHRAETVEDTTYVDVFGVTRLVDSYTQPFLAIEGSLLGTTGLWLLGGVEIGHRDYATDTSFDSDFLYLDLSASAEVPLGHGVSLLVMANLSPERHRAAEDNTVTNYTSADLLWRFR